MNDNPIEKIDFSDFKNSKIKRLEIKNSEIDKIHNLRFLFHLTNLEYLNIKDH